MLRITEHFENGTAIRFRLDGTISDESYKELESAFSGQDQTAAKTIILDMAGVDFMSDQSARRLAQLRSERLRIINCSPFILTLLETLGGLGVEQ